MIAVPTLYLRYGRGNISERLSRLRHEHVAQGHVAADRTGASPTVSFC